MIRKLKSLRSRKLDPATRKRRTWARSGCVPSPKSMIAKCDIASDTEREKPCRRDALQHRPLNLTRFVLHYKT